jgi:hypothetical protein
VKADKRMPPVGEFCGKCEGKPAKIKNEMEGGNYLIANGNIVSPRYVEWLEETTVPLQAPMPDEAWFEEQRKKIIERVQASHKTEGEGNWIAIDQYRPGRDMEVEFKISYGDVYIGRWDHKDVCFYVKGYHAAALDVTHWRPTKADSSQTLTAAFNHAATGPNDKYAHIRQESFISGSDWAFSQLAQRLEETERQLAIHEQDLTDAAGELMIQVPEPGTDIAKMMHANRMLKYQIDDKREEIRDLKARLSDIETNSESKPSTAAPSPAIPDKGSETEPGKTPRTPQQIWYSRNPCHDFDDAGIDRFYRTAFMCMQDYADQETAAANARIKALEAERDVYRAALEDLQIILTPHFRITP